MQKITLKQSIQITEINKRTTALFFKDIEVGDIIDLSIAVEHQRYWNHPLVTAYGLVNRTNNSITKCTINLLVKYLSYFNYIILN